MAVGPREFYPTLPSTQDRALELARTGAPEGTRVVAQCQTGGRGRLSRTWASPTGGLYCSVIVRRPREHPGLLPLSVGALLAVELREAYRVPIALKWPNDLLVQEPGKAARKLSGILADEARSPALGRVVVVGVGVNVRLDRAVLAPALSERIAALEEYVRPPPDLEEVEAMVVRSAVGGAERLTDEDGTREVLALGRELLYGVGRPVTVDGVPAGTIATIGEEGELLLVPPGDRVAERVAIWAGDVRVEEAT